MCDKEYLLMTHHHKYLLMTSQASLMCALWGGVNNNMLCVIPAGVYINSVNYWRNPVCGMRRNIDMTWGITGLMINNACAYYSTNAYPYYGITLLACLMYPLSYYFYWRKQYIIATFLHGLLHIFANIGNIYLYTGTYMK